MTDDEWERKITALMLTQICTASLSVLGSGIIIFKILRDRAKNGYTTPYDRFMIGLSAGDILWSITCAINDFLITPSEFDVWWAFGNVTTCKASGFLSLLSLLTWWYNGLLSYFFLLTVLSQIRKKNYVQQFEPWMHLSAAYFPITAILGLFLGWYCSAEVPGWTVFLVLIPVGLAVLSIFINYVAIYVIVRKSLRSEHVAGSVLIKKETTTLMILYVASVAVTLVPEIFNSIFKWEQYYVYFFVDILLPLQGFWNFFIYIKPVYAQFRATHPNESKWFVLKQAILKSKAPPLQHRRVANNITNRSDVLITDITLLSNREMNPSEALFYPGQISSGEFNNPQSDDPSNPPETNVDEEGRPTSSNDTVRDPDRARNT